MTDPRKEPGVAQNVSILILEDDELIRDVLSTSLTQAGYEVRACPDGASGLAAMRERPADIVLSDIRMHGMDGVEVLKRVRAEWPQSEVILITGYATVEAAIEALRHGAYDLLLKPLRLEQLERVIRNCAERIRCSRENLELRRVVDQLREINDRREKFVALANHELRTPTAAACGVLGLLKKRAADLPPDVVDLVDRVGTAMDRLRQIVNDIGELATSRTETDWIRRAPCRLGDLAADLDRLCDEYRALRDVNIAVEMQSDPATLLFLDRGKATRALGALVQNAVKFTPDGGRVEARFLFDGDCLEAAVSDTGVGVPPEEKEKIFDLFYKVGEALNHHTSGHAFGGGGLGIGLPYARIIARAHEGEVSYAPRNGGGSVFTLEIPCRVPPELLPR